MVGARDTHSPSAPSYGHQQRFERIKPGPGAKSIEHTE